MRFLCLLLLISSANAQSGLYSFEQECSTGYCPLTAGPASCFAIGLDSRGGTCVITAKHCTTQTQNRFYVVTKSGYRHRAIMVWRSPNLDIACLRVPNKLVTPPIRLDTPPVGTVVMLKGVISKRYQESKGRVRMLEPSGKIWFRGLWSHAGMSGGALTDMGGVVFGVHHSSIIGSDETIGVGGLGFRQAVEQYERRNGKLTLAAGSIRVQQSPPAGTPLMRSDGSMCQSCGRPDCQKCNNARRVDCVPATVAIPRATVDYQQAADAVFEKYGDQLRGRDGNDGTPAKQIDLDELADLITTRYGDRIRGRDGVNGSDGAPARPASVNYQQLANVFFERYGDQLRGRDGTNGRNGNDGAQGPRGLIGVPDDQDIRNWLVGASSDPETRAMLAATFADIVSTAPRVEELIRRLEALENREPGEFPVTEIATKFAAVDRRLGEIAATVVPVRIKNSDGSIFSEDPDRTLLEPIEIRLLPPDRN